MEAFLSDIELALRTALRSHDLYDRLREVHVSAFRGVPCGWRAHVTGSFTAADRKVCEQVVQKLQRAIALTSEPDFVRPRKIAARA